jgi:hypothetical protein
MRVGIEKTAMIRLRAGISYVLTEGMDEGHCGLPTDQIDWPVNPRLKRTMRDSHAQPCQRVCGVNRRIGVIFVTM